MYTAAAALPTKHSAKMTFTVAKNTKGGLCGFCIKAHGFCSRYHSDAQPNGTVLLNDDGTVAAASSSSSSSSAPPPPPPPPPPTAAEEKSNAVDEGHAPTIPPELIESVKAPASSGASKLLSSFVNGLGNGALAIGKAALGTKSRGRSREVTPATGSRDVTPATASRDVTPDAFAIARDASVARGSLRPAPQRNVFVPQEPPMLAEMKKKSRSLSRPPPGTVKDRSTLEGAIAHNPRVLFESAAPAANTAAVDDAPGAAAAAAAVPVVTESAVKHNQDSNVGQIDPLSKYSGIPLSQLEMLYERGLQNGISIPESEMALLKQAIKKAQQDESNWDPRKAIEELNNPDEVNPILRAGRSFQAAQQGVDPHYINSRINSVFKTGFRNRDDYYSDAGYGGYSDPSAPSNPLVRNINSAYNYYAAGSPDVGALMHREHLKDTQSAHAQYKIGTDTTRAVVNQIMQDQSIFAAANRNSVQRYDKLLNNNIPNNRIESNQPDVEVHAHEDYMMALFKR